MMLSLPTATAFHEQDCSRNVSLLCEIVSVPTYKCIACAGQVVVQRSLRCHLGLNTTRDSCHTYDACYIFAFPVPDRVLLDVVTDWNLS